VRTGREQLGHDRRGRVEHVLTVVDDNQQARTVRRYEQRRAQGVLGTHGPETRGHDMSDRTWILDLGQRADIAGTAGRAGGDRPGQSRLPHAPGTGEGDQPVPGDQPDQTIQLRVTTHQRTGDLDVLGRHPSTIPFRAGAQPRSRNPCGRCDDEAHGG
jgi:hypothetical protein